MTRELREAMPRWLLAAFCIGAAIIAAPFVTWIVFGVWLGRYARKIHRPVMRVLHGRRGLSATVTVILMLLVFVPIAALLTSIVVDAIALVQQLMESPTGKTVLQQLAGGPKAGTQVTEHAFNSADVVDLIRAQGARAWAIATSVAGATARVVVGMLILITCIYGILVDGDGWYAWIEKHAPVPPESLRRLADAFTETGRGLAYGIVGAGLIQAIVSTIAYVVLGVPSALALGLLTLILSVVPAVGTAIVWVPVTIGLALTDRTGAAIALAVIGVGVIGTVDNLARPYLARRGHLALPTLVVLVSMFGGVELLGGWGLILGPLIVRLAKEAVAIRAEAVS